PVTDQNVVTYNTIIAVDNTEQLLMPGMTATVSVVVRRSQDVLRLPVAALRFRPEGTTPEAATAPRASPRTAPGSGDATRRGAGAGAPRPGREATVYVPE